MDWLPFFVVGCGLLFVAVGLSLTLVAAWGLYWTLREDSGIGRVGPAEVPTAVSADPAADVEVKVRTQLRFERIVGNFWFCIGITQLWFSDFRAPWISAKYRAALKLGPAMLALESAEWQIPNHLAGAGAVRSTGRDMMTFLKANMGLVPTPFDAAIQRSHQRAGTSTGLNWIRSFKSILSQHVIWHNGGTGGFSAYLGFTEDRQFGVFVLSSTATRIDAWAEGILEAIVREHER